MNSLIPDSGGYLQEYLLEMHRATTALRRGLK
jgi:hypothetical protein